MAQDYILPVRQALVTALEHDPPLGELIPDGSIYPGKVPAARTFPFVRIGTVIASPFRASGLDSTAVRFTVQGFTKALLNTGAAELVTAEDCALLIGSAIKDALDGAPLTLSTGHKLRLTWVQTSPARDGAEADAWMTTVTFTGDVAG